MRRSGWWVATWLGVITGLGAALRLAALGSKSLWHDEAVLYGIASAPWSEFIASNAVSNSAPPLFPLLVRGVMAFGTSESVLRAAACIAGIASVPAMYGLGRRFLPRTGALLAAAMVAVAPVQVRYAQEVREYTLAFLLAVLMLWAFSSGLDRPTLARGAAASAVVAVSMFTQHGLALLFVAVSLAVLAEWQLEGRHRPGLRFWSGTCLAALVAAATVSQLGLRQQRALIMQSASTYLSAGFWDGSAADLWRLAIHNTTGIVRLALPGDVAAFALVLGIGWMVTRAPRPGSGLAPGSPVPPRSGRLALLLLGLPPMVVLGAALAGLYPYIPARQVIVLTPMIYVLVAAGIIQLGRVPATGWVPAVATVVILGQSLQGSVGILRSPGQEHLRPVVERMLALAAPGDGIYVNPGAEPAARYYLRGIDRAWVTGAPLAGTLEDDIRQLDGLLSDNRTHWLVFAHIAASDVKTIVSRVAGSEEIVLIHAEPGAWLFRAGSPRPAVNPQFAVVEVVRAITRQSGSAK